MNTKLNLSEDMGQHLVLLSDGTELDWADNYLNIGDVNVLAKGIQNEVRSFAFPGSERFIFIQILKNKKGSNDSASREEARLAGAELLETIEHYKIQEVTIVNKMDDSYVAEFAEGMVLGNYQFLKYFSDKAAKRNSLRKVNILASNMGKRAFDRLKAVLIGTCKARDLVNEPHSYLNAPTYSKEIKELGKTYGFSVKVLKKKKIEELGMGGLLSVNQGSFVPPTFNIMEWMPTGAKNDRPVILVGKGVMFDTGGVSLKPTKNSMDFMKCDMGGAAAVTGIMVAIAKAKLPLKVVALVGATDNRPGNDAYLPGDVVKTLSGITVEILNTDAEGRMTLADSLHYAKRYNPELVLDFATLTGAAAYSIGPEASCYMGNADIKIKSKMEESGYRTYERLVEFPMWKEYGETIKSDIADIKNLGAPYAGMITAGKFLEHFTDYPWLHFDIAGTAYMHKKSGYRTKEGTGVGVRLIFDFLMNY